MQFFLRNIMHLGALVNMLAIFLMNALFKDVFQAIVKLFTRKYRVA